MDDRTLIQMPEEPEPDKTDGEKTPGASSQENQKPESDSTQEEWSDGATILTQPIRLEKPNLSQAPVPPEEPPVQPASEPTLEEDLSGATVIMAPIRLPKEEAPAPPPVNEPEPAQAIEPPVLPVQPEPTWEPDSSGATMISAPKMEPSLPPQPTPQAHDPLKAIEIPAPPESAWEPDLSDATMVSPRIQQTVPTPEPEQIVEPPAPVFEAAPMPEEQPTATFEPLQIPEPVIEEPIVPEPEPVEALEFPTPIAPELPLVPEQLGAQVPELYSAQSPAIIEPELVNETPVVPEEQPTATFEPLQIPEPVMEEPIVPEPEIEPVLPLVPEQLGAQVPEPYSAQSPAILEPELVIETPTVPEEQPTATFEPLEIPELVIESPVVPEPEPVEVVEPPALIEPELNLVPEQLGAQVPPPIIEPEPVEAFEPPAPIEPELPLVPEQLGAQVKELYSAQSPAIVEPELVIEAPVVPEEQPTATFEPLQIPEPAMEAPVVPEPEPVAAYEPPAVVEPEPVGAFEPPAPIEPELNLAPEQLGAQVPDEFPAIIEPEPVAVIEPPVVVEPELPLVPERLGAQVLDESPANIEPEQEPIVLSEWSDAVESEAQFPTLVPIEPEPDYAQATRLSAPVSLPEPVVEPEVPVWPISEPEPQIPVEPLQGVSFSEWQSNKLDSAPPADLPAPGMETGRFPAPNLEPEQEMATSAYRGIEEELPAGFAPIMASDALAAAAVEPESQSPKNSGQVPAAMGAIPTAANLPPLAAAPPPAPPLPTPPPAAPKLSFTLPDKTKVDVPLTKDTIGIGRGPGNDIILQSEMVSKNHARMIRQGDTWFIEDLGSTNGIYVGGERIPARQLTRLPASLDFSVGRDIKAILPPPPGATPVARAARFSTRTLIVAGIVALLLMGVVGGAAAVVGNLNQNRQGAAKVYPENAFLCTYPQMALVPPAGVTVPAGTVLDSSIYITPPPPGNTISYITPPASSGLAPNFNVEGPGTPIVTFTPGPAATMPPSRPIFSIAFLDLPFPYDGGNVSFSGTREQFITASQSSSSPGGRINSFFDHFFPLYPAPKDPNLPGGDEPADDPIGSTVTLYTGINSNYVNYTGHPALDYAPFERGKSTTPVFAAADGVISFVGIHKASGAYFVKINHFVPNVGGFQTIYWHLEPDAFYDAMVGREGENITAGTRVGTMGNTGWSTGHHLHFEVRFDRNNDGQFSNLETIDPYGWIPSVDNPSDPWYQRSGLDSHYLWIHPIGSQATVAADGSGVLSQDAGKGGAGLDETAITSTPSASASTIGKETTICAPPGSLPPGGTVNLSAAPDPDPTQNQAGAGAACVLSVLDAGGVPVSSFNPAIQISLPFSKAGIENLDPATLRIFWLFPGSQEWVPLETTLDMENSIATAFTNQPGQCALMGVPTEDIVPPVTTFSVVGNLGIGDNWYETVEVTLGSEDPSGVEKTEYSLDGGETWLLYTGPFIVEPNGLPEPVEKMDEEFFAGGAGRFLVLASSTDKEGNVEYPPAYYQLLIDPSKDPNPPKETPPTLTPTPTPSATGTATPSATPTPSVTPTPTIAACVYNLTLTKSAFCRKGPGSVYDVVNGFNPNTVLEVIGQNEVAEPKWWQVLVPNSTTKCWVSGTLGDITAASGIGDLSTALSCVAPVKAPPTPTPTFTPSPTLTPTPTPRPPGVPSLIEPYDGSNQYCDDINFYWSDSAPFSAVRYEFVLEYSEITYSAATYAMNPPGPWYVLLTTETDKPTFGWYDVSCEYHYQWKVRAFDKEGLASPFSDYFYFIIHGE